VLAFADRVRRTRHDPDLRKGAVEGDRPSDAQQWNRNAPGIDDRGWPNDAVAIAQDVIGANEDDTEGG
jgi:hypothetical protein